MSHILIIVLVIACLSLGLFIFYIASFWKLLNKAQKPGWASIVPFYNYWVLAEIAGKPGWMGLIACLSFSYRFADNSMGPTTGLSGIALVVSGLIGLVAFIFWLIISIGVAKNFGKSTAFGFLVGLLPFIGIPILAFGKSQYKGEKTKESKALILSIISVCVIVAVGIVVAVILLLVPAVKRSTQNTERHNDVLAIADTYKTYETNVAAILPVYAQPQNKQLEICSDISCQNGNAYDSLTFYLPKNVTIKSYSPGLTEANVNSVLAVNNATCNSNNSGLGSYQTHTVAILYATAKESGSTNMCYTVPSYNYNDPNAFPYCGVIPNKNMSLAAYDYLLATITENKAKQPISNDIKSHNDVTSQADITLTVQADKQFLNSIDNIGFASSASNDAKRLETDITTEDNLVLTESSEYNNVPQSLQMQISNAAATRSADAGTLRQDLNLPASTCSFLSP